MAEGVVGPWAKEKLERLRKYLHAYTTIMKDQGQWCKSFSYIDAFASPGEHEIRQRTNQSSDAQQAILDVATFGSEQEEQQLLLAGFSACCAGPAISIYSLRIRGAVSKTRCRVGQIEGRILGSKYCYS